MERQVIVAKSAGFCFGVERAVARVYEQIQAVKEGKAQGPIYTYGPIIHNEEVVRDLEEKDVQVLDTEEDLENLPEGQGTVIIRSHGVSRHVYDILNSRGVNVVDATCPFVKKIHKIVDEHSRAGEAVIIIGSPVHPEVEGIRGWGNGDTVVVENEADAEDYNLPEGKKLCIVSQTTFNYNKFQELGEEMEAKVIKLNDGVGMVSLSYKRMAADRGNKRLEEAFENQEVLTAKVAQVLDGGLSVEVEGSRVFIPASLVSDTYEKDLSKYAGQEIQFVITEFNPKRRRIIGDRKQLLVTEKAKLKEELFSKIQVGDKVEGTVKNVTDFGAFIDLGGADGLLHISEMSWGRVENPKKVFKSGDKVTVLIKDIQGEKIALSLKFPEANPWAHAAEKYAAGSVVTGRVARMTDFGAFVELEPGVDALLHVSQISREHIEKPADVLKIGQEIEAKVVDFNEDDHKISLSVKALQAAPQNEDVADVDIDSYAK